MISKYRWLGATAVVAMSTLAQPALAQVQRFNIPAQDVTSAVLLFARQSGMQIIVANNVGAGHRTNAVTGKLPASDALERMLAKTGLIAISTGANRYVIVPGEWRAQGSDTAPDTVPVPADIVVTGFRASQREAVAEKRAADNVIETLHANDVGKLPDQNVAEAIKRLPGLSVANDQGEGRYAIVRGIDPSLLNVTLNGQTLPAPEPAGRQVKLDDLPSAMIQSVAVTKSLLPSQDANAIAGEVAIRTRTGFDSAKPFFLDARAAQGWYSLNHKVPYELDGTVGGRFGARQQFGAVVSVNYSQRPIESQNYQGSTNWVNGVPDGNGLRDYNLTRTRLGVVGNFDWHASDTVKLYLRTSYSKFQDHETRDQNRLAITTPGATPKATGTILVRNRNEDDNTKSVTLGGEFGQVAGGTLELSGNWTRAEKLDPLRSEFTFTTAKGALTSTYDPSTYPYTLTPTTPAFTTPSLFTFSKVNFDQRSTYEELWQGRFDYTHDIGIGDGSTFKLGGKYLTRDKFNDQNKTNYKATKTVWTLANPVGYPGASDFYDGMFGFGTRINYDAAKAYFDANSGVAAIDKAGTLSDTLSNDFDVREKIAAGYVMATLKLGGLTLVPGVRVEHTEDDVKAKLVTAASTLTDGYNSFGHTSYTDVFPGVNAKFEFARNLLLRGAVTTSIGRPNYANLAPFVVVDTSDPSAAAISLGNANLKPYRAVNYDAALEYYPAPGAILSAGAFHKQIDNPIYSNTNRQTNFTAAGVTYAAANVTQLLNADSETITGVEGNVQVQFTFLPGVLSGFGVSANFTHVWGHANAGVIRAGDVPLAYQSKNVGNAQIFFEKSGLSARVAFNYRSSYLDTIATTAAADQYTDGNGQLDVHLSYQVTPQFTLFGDATNLTDAPWRRYIGTRTQLVERERYGTQLRGGVQIHF
ncbi:TonB-dependent receptor [Sphingomonas sp. 22176]|uniref:TonB-dependent receptor n=1 Tax=Sphingomonas sp. 22176 TaxID=3453884 RepID=UPI003F832657